jgi:hypothetical protein
MVGAAHLLNIEKLQLFARCFLQIGKMQSQIYNLRSLRLVQICLLSEFRLGQHLSSTNAAQWSKDVYDKSLQMEGHGVSSKTTHANNGDSFHILKEDDRSTMQQQGQTSVTVPAAGILLFILFCVCFI